MEHRRITKEAKRFGELIKQLRLKNTKYSLRQFSKLLRKEDGNPISPSYLSGIETGRRNPPSPYVIGQMATFLKVDEGALLREAGKTSPKLEEVLSENPLLQKILRKVIESGFDDWKYRASITEPRLSEFVNERQLILKILRKVGKTGLDDWKTRDALVEQKLIEVLNENPLLLTLLRKVIQSSFDEWKIRDAMVEPTIITKFLNQNPLSREIFRTVIESCFDDWKTRGFVVKPLKETEG